jgi:hypothetical protein
MEEIFKCWKNLSSGICTYCTCGFHDVETMEALAGKWRPILNPERALPAPEPSQV